MRRFLQMLLAVLFCTTAMCITDVCAATSTSANAGKKVIVVNKEDHTSNADTASQSTTNQKSIQSVKPTTNNIVRSTYSNEEVYLMAQVIHHEAHNQPYAGKVAIAEVVLNRIKSRIFPSSIDSVVFQTGQFSNSRRIRNINPTDEELKIADGVLNGSLRVFNDINVLYFRNPTIAIGVSADVDRDWGTLDYVTSIGDHAFYSQILKNSPITVDNSSLKANKKTEAAKNSNTLGKSESALTEGSKNITGSKKNEDSDDMVETILDPEYVQNEMLLAAAHAAAINIAITKAQEEEIDENDPVALAQRQAKLDAEREEKQRAAMQAEYDKARQNASEEAQKNVMQATMRVEAALSAGQQD